MNREELDPVTVRQTGLGFVAESYARWTTPRGRRLGSRVIARWFPTRAKAQHYADRVNAERASR